MKKIKLKDIGTSYSIMDTEDEYMGTVMVMYYRDLLSATIGDYSENTFRDYHDYMSKLKSCVIDPLTSTPIYWHVCKDELSNEDFINMFNKCINGKYQYVIIEILKDELTNQE